MLSSVVYCNLYISLLCLATSGGGGVLEVYLLLQQV